MARCTRIGSRLAMSMALLLSTAPAAATAAGRPLPYDELVQRLTEAARQPWIEIEEIGSSVERRPLLLLHLSRGEAAAGWKVLFFAQQHGDEPAGRVALAELVASIARDPACLPDDVDLWIVPSVNPDGGEASRRVNANGADLNRDHLLLLQPETRALHDAVARVEPHVVVDCHEFSRDSSSYTEKGWYRWPIITMGTANHPFLPPSVFEVGLRWVETARQPMAEAGFAYERYLVGGTPPDDEIRPSTLQANDGRNGLASRGSLGFIIESGMFEDAANPQADLDRRVAAYLTLLRRFLDDHDLRAASLAAVAEARDGARPRFLPTNVMWANAGNRTDVVRVVRASDDAVLEIPTGNLMHDRVVKGTVATPEAYVVDAGQAPPYAELLDRHGITYRRLDSPTELVVEGAVLERVEDEDDPLYERYGGRQIVSRRPAGSRVFEPGALLVPVDQPLAVRVLQLLEPNQLYGLYQYPELQETVAWDGTLPVWRVPAERPER